MSSEPKRGRGRPRQSLSIEKPPQLSLSTRAIRDIMALARDTKIEVNQVVEDVVTNGLIQTRGMYSEVIEARRSLEAKRNEYRRKVSAEPEYGRSEETVDNGVDERSSTGPDEFDQGFRSKSGDVDLEPRHVEADLAGPEDFREPLNLVGDPPF